MILVEGLCLELRGFRLSEVSLEARRGDYMVVLGPSGSGKTLLLESIAGLRRPSKGRVYINGLDVTHLPPELRGAALVPQSYALWPHMSVQDNIAYPLRHRGWSRREIEARVRWIASELGINHLLNRRPQTLSGGEQQRVALARALIWEPTAVLLDEPTAALDPALRGEAWRLLSSLHRGLGFTAIHVTHDVAEAAALASRAAFMCEGRVVKQGSLEEVLASEEASKYLGDTNVLRGVITKSTNGEIVVDVGGCEVVAVAKGSLGDYVALLLRPEDVMVLRPGAHDVSARNIIEVVVEGVEPRGPLMLIRARRDRLFLNAYVTKSSLEHLEIRVGARVLACFKASALKKLA